MSEGLALSPETLDDQPLTSLAYDKIRAASSIRGFRRPIPNRRAESAQATELLAA